MRRLRSHACLTFVLLLLPNCTKLLPFGVSPELRSKPKWQARRESNPQPAVLETAALPIELLACTETTQRTYFKFLLKKSNYSMIFVTTPAPTVRPPSRIAKRRPSSMAIGAIRVTLIFTLSPGITISTPSGSSQEPVTSVVRK